jgi:TonB family protein
MSKLHPLSLLIAWVVSSTDSSADPPTVSPLQESNAADVGLVNKPTNVQPVSAADRILSARARAVKLKNDGRAALKAQDYPIAIQKFSEALKIYPGYGQALSSLTAAYCDYGVTLRKNPDLALKQFHQALFYDRRNATTLERVEEAIKTMGKNSQNFHDRVKLGDKARANADFVGATMEYAAALRLKNDPAVEIKLRNADRKLTTTEKRISHHNSETNSATKIDDSQTDYGSYFADLQRRIMRTWLPPKQRETAQVVIFFKVHKSGEVSDVRVNRSSGINIVDQAAIRAIENAAPLKPLPPDNLDAVDIAITFEHNIIATTEGAKKDQPDLSKSTSPKPSMEEVMHQYVDPNGHYPVPVMVWIYLNTDSFQ